MTQQKATCCKCGAAIKNEVHIGGKVYGTSCAETILGTKLPAGFTGNADEYLANVEAEFSATREATKKGWGINLYFTQAAKNAANEWEKTFVDGLAEKCGATILLEYGKPLVNLSFDDAVSNWDNWARGAFPWTEQDLNARFDRLTEKQKAVLARIHNNK